VACHWGVHDEAEIEHTAYYIGGLPTSISGIRRPKPKDPCLCSMRSTKRTRFPRRSGVGLARSAVSRANRHSVTYRRTFDSSKVLFITMRHARPLRQPLRDRMEITNFSGYRKKKRHTLRSKHLIPPRSKRTHHHETDRGFRRSRKLYHPHTRREAGVRN